MLTLFLRESAFLSLWYGWLSSHHIIILTSCVWQNYFNSFFCWWSKSLVFSFKKKFACMYSWRHPPLCEAVELTSSLLFLFWPCKCPALFKNTSVNLWIRWMGLIDMCGFWQGLWNSRFNVLLLFQYNCLTMRGLDRYIPLGNFNN